MRPVIRDPAPGEIKPVKRGAHLECLSDGTTATANECVPADVCSLETRAFRKGVGEDDAPWLLQRRSRGVERRGR